jgi:hypothetical protein
MLERSLDRQPLEALTTRPPLEHDNLRGAAYFDRAARYVDGEVTSSQEDTC